MSGKRKMGKVEKRRIIERQLRDPQCGPRQALSFLRILRGLEGKTNRVTAADYWDLPPKPEKKPEEEQVDKLVLKIEKERKQAEKRIEKPSEVAPVSVEQERTARKSAARVELERAWGSETAVAPAEQASPSRDDLTQQLAALGRSEIEQGLRQVNSNVRPRTYGHGPVVEADFDSE